ncbi:MAG: DUF6049 family protein [Propionibacteriales bacterium]|nr:DUF6049 family protein [Propionibacteriales bacterium]
MRNGASWARRLTRGLAVAAAVVIAFTQLAPGPSRAADSVQLSLVMTSLSTTGTKPDDRVSLKLTVTNTGTIPAYGVVAHLWRSRDAIRDQASLLSVADGGATLGGWSQGTGSYLLITNSTTAFQPGATRSFTLSATLKQLGFDTRAAAYAFGADVVATADQSSNNSVVAKARTLLSLPGKAAVPITSIVVLTAAPTKGVNGIFTSDQLATELTGRLSDLLDAAEDGDVSWLIDPALLDEVIDQADGYQVLTGKKLTPGTGQQVATDWLARFNRLDRSRGARTLFASPDIASSSAHHLSDIFTWSKGASAAVPGISELPLVVVPGNVTSDELAFVSAAGAQAVLATNARLAGAVQSTATSLPLLAAQSVKPSTDPQADAALQQRQLMLAQTAISGAAGQVRLLTTPEAVGLDAETRPGWSTRRSVTETLETGASRAAELSAVKPVRLTEDQFALRERVGADFDSYLDLVPGSTFVSQREAAALRSISTAWVTDAAAGDAFASGMAGVIGRDAIGSRIRLDISSRLVMSARSNQFPVTITNQAFEPVSVRVVVTSNNPQRLSIAPSEVVTVEPGQSQTVNIRPEATGNGVISARAHITTASGRRVGVDHRGRFGCRPGGCDRLANPSGSPP